MQSAKKVVLGIVIFFVVAIPLLIAISFYNETDDMINPILVPTVTGNQISPSESRNGTDFTVHVSDSAGVSGGMK